MIYNKKFYDAQCEGSCKSASVIVPIVLKALVDEPESIVDFGCGTGSFLNEFKAALPNCEIKGMDFGEVSSNLLISPELIYLKNVIWVKNMIYVYR